MNKEKILELENKITEQQKEITELKRLVIKLGEEKDKGKEVVGTSYWIREIFACNSSNYVVCTVCESVPNAPKMPHYLKIKTCSPSCSVIVEEMLTKKVKN